MICITTTTISAIPTTTTATAAAGIGMRRIAVGAAGAGGCTNTGERTTRDTNDGTVPTNELNRKHFHRIHDSLCFGTWPAALPSLPPHTPSSTHGA